MFGLLVVTGMRIGEALTLDRSDFDDLGAHIIGHEKLGNCRELPLHPSTTRAIAGYLCRRDRLGQPAAEAT